MWRTRDKIVLGIIQLTILGSIISLSLFVAIHAAGIANPVRTTDQVVVGQPQIHWDKAVTVQETEDVLVVKPRVNFDPLGGFLMADAREKQIRRYADDGTLERVIARRGDGPGEFRHPVEVLRLPSAVIVGVDMRGRLAIFDRDGKTLIETQQVPLTPIYSAAALDDSTIVFAGKNESARSSQLIHVWDLKRKRIISSFGDTPAHPQEFESGFAFTGSPAVAVRDGKIAMIFALSDSIWTFDRAGHTLAKPIKIPWQRYRPLTKPMPDSDAGIEEWLSTFSAAGSLFWRQDGSFVVQYLDVNGSDERWSFVGVSSTGTHLFEFYDRPRLLDISEDGQTLLFIDPNSELQNSWARASIH